MAEPSSSTSPEAITVAEEPASIQPEPDNPNHNQLPTRPPEPQQPSSTPLPNPNPSTPPPTSLIHPLSIQPYAAVVPPSVPSFRSAAPPLPQFSPLPPNPNLLQPPSYHTPSGVLPPGVSAVPQPPVMMQPPPLSGAGQIPGQPLRPPFAPMPNGFPGIPQLAPQGTIPAVY